MVRNKLKVAGIGVTSVALLVAGLGAAPATAAKSSLVVENVFQLTSTDPARSFEQTGNMINHALYETLITYKGGDASTAGSGNCLKVALQLECNFIQFHN